MNFVISKYPALKLLFLIVIGIGFGFIVEFQNIFVINLIIIIALISAILIWKKLLNFAYFLISITIGFTLIHSVNYNNLKLPHKVINEFKGSCSGKVLQVLKTTETSQRFLFEGWIDAEPFKKIENVRAIINIRFFNKKALVKQGEEIYCKGKFRTPLKKQFPGEFDEINYLKWNSAHFLAETNADDVSLIANPNWYDDAINKINDDINYRIGKLYNDNSKGIILALINGDRSLIPWDVKQSFSNSGTNHVLSVSGLHVGIISAIIFFLLAFISNQWIKFIIFSVMVTIYVIISGVQDAAVRSGMMAIAIVLVKVIQREYKLPNIIAFVTVIAIVFKPSLIVSSGFQMSVLSVLGISLFYDYAKKLVNMIIPWKNYVIEFFKSSIAVSLAATIVISPIVAYYFDIYSLISPLANLFVIPLMSLALIFGVISLIFSYVSFGFAQYYAYTASFMVDASIYINNFTLEIPLSFLKGNSTLVLSIISSISLLYIIFSRTINHFVFRVVVVILAFFLLLKIIPEKNDLKIYPRLAAVVAELPEYNNSKLIIFADRVKNQKFRNDFAMENYLMDCGSKNLVILSNGKFGRKIYNNIKDKKSVKFVRIDDAYLAKIKNKLNLKTNFNKINTYD